MPISPEKAAHVMGLQRRPDVVRGTTERADDSPRLQAEMIAGGGLGRLYHNLFFDAVATLPSHATIVLVGTSNFAVAEKAAARLAAAAAGVIVDRVIAIDLSPHPDVPTMANSIYAELQAAWTGDQDRTDVLHSVLHITDNQQYTLTQLEQKIAAHEDPGEDIVLTADASDARTAQLIASLTSSTAGLLVIGRNISPQQPGDKKYEGLFEHVGRLVAERNAQQIPSGFVFTAPYHGGFGDMLIANAEAALQTLHGQGVREEDLTIRAPSGIILGAQVSPQLVGDHQWDRRFYAVGAKKP